MALIGFLSLILQLAGTCIPSAFQVTEEFMKASLKIGRLPNLSLSSLKEKTIIGNEGVGTFGATFVDVADDDIRAYIFVVGIRIENEGVEKGSGK